MNTNDWKMSPVLYIVSLQTESIYTAFNDIEPAVGS